MKVHLRAIDDLTELSFVKMANAADELSKYSSLLIVLIEEGNKFSILKRIFARFIQPYNYVHRQSRHD